jgi:hypothetical protein
VVKSEEGRREEVYHQDAKIAKGREEERREWAEMLGDSVPLIRATPTGVTNSTLPAYSLPMAPLVSWW